MRAHSFARCSFLFAAMLVAAATSAQASVQISSNPTHNMNCADGVCTPTAKNADLNATDLANMLATSDVRVMTGSGAVTITVSQSFSWTSTHRLMLDANKTVSFRAPVVVAGQGSVTIATNDGGAGGDLLFFPGATLDFWDADSNLFINGDSYTLVEDVATLASDIASNPSGFYAFARDYDASESVRPQRIKNFAGTFEGLGHAISNLVISHYRLHGGFIEVLDQSGVARDLGLVNVTVSNGVAGLVISNYGRIIGSYVTGSVTGSWFDGLGGLTGYNLGTVLRCNSDVVVTGIGTYGVGGLVGYNVGNILESFAAGSVTGNAMVGGLVGSQEGGLVSQSYSTASVSYLKHRLGGDLGGLVGRVESGQIQESYSTGAVVTPTRKLFSVGGSIGTELTSPNQISSIFWDLDTSGISDPSQGAGNIANDPGITGLTDTQLKSGLPSGFDPNVWGPERIDQQRLSLSPRQSTTTIERCCPRVLTGSCGGGRSAIWGFAITP